MPAFHEIIDVMPSWLHGYLDGSRLLTSVFERLIQKGTLTLVDAAGHIHTFGDGDQPKTVMRIHDPSIQFKLALYPGYYLADGYMRGQWEVEEGNLKETLDLLFMNLQESPTSPGWFSFTDLTNNIMRRLQQINTVTRSKKHVEHHYDLTLPFYDLFLDPDRQYSCAYFSENRSESLEEAQLKKKIHLQKKLLLESSHHVLDIGCGWGGLALHLARASGSRVTGITLSESQLEVARARAKEEDLDDLVDFQLMDYRSVNGRYDRVVSVGMFEHVGLNAYPVFFERIRDLLKEDGIALLHSIARSSSPVATNPWIRKYIFPGGYIPSVSEVVPHVERTGLHMTDLEILRMHYAETLCEWRERFIKQRKAAEEMYDEMFCRMWEFYLAASEASFEHFGLMVFQMQMSAQPNVVPITRDYIYTEPRPPRSLAEVSAAKKEG